MPGGKKLPAILSGGVAVIVEGSIDDRVLDDQLSMRPCETKPLTAFPPVLLLHLRRLHCICPSVWMSLPLQKPIIVICKNAPLGCRFCAQAKKCQITICAPFFFSIQLP